MDTKGKLVRSGLLLLLAGLGATQCVDVVFQGIVLGLAGNFGHDFSGSLASLTQESLVRLQRSWGLNHELQDALGRALTHALRSLESEYLHQKPTLKMTSGGGDRRLVVNLFHELRDEVARLPDLYKQDPHKLHELVLAGPDADGKALLNLLSQLSGNPATTGSPPPRWETSVPLDDNVVKDWQDYIEKNIALRVAESFVRELQSNDAAWRQFQLLSEQELRQSVESLPKVSGEIKLLRSDLNEWKEQLKGSLAGQRNAVGDKQLNASLKAMTVELENIREGQETGFADTQELIKTQAERVVDEIKKELIRERRSSRHLGSALTWAQLQTASLRITAQRSGSTLRAYDNLLYLERQSVGTVFGSFLRDRSETVFLLLGKSGVGKSYFLAALTEEAKARGDCVVLYDGQFMSAERPLAEQIEADLVANLPTPGRGRDIYLGNPPAELARIRDRKARKVILAIDAISENADPVGLLANINRFVLEVSPAYEWFKVVLGARTEAWRALRRTVDSPTGRYYQLPEHSGAGLPAGALAAGAGGLGVIIPPFSESDDDRTNELGLVYAKYENFYKLQTPFSKLPLAVRRAVSDPLMLRLVAETSRGQGVAEARTFAASRICRAYMGRLFEDRRLTEEDVGFLRAELVPLMIDEAQLTNTVSAHQVRAHRLQSGQPLADWIERYKDRPEKEQAFKRLVDTGILAPLQSQTDYQIRFLYQSFYDYFAGQGLYELVRKTPSQHHLAFYARKVEQAHEPEQSYLLGPLREALLKHTNDTGPDILFELCLLPRPRLQQTINELAITTLTAYGNASPDNGDDLTKRLLRAHAPLASLPERLGRWRAFRVDPELRGRESAPEQCPPHKRIAIAVAAELGQNEPLKIALKDPIPAVRLVAVQHAFMTWHRRRKLMPTATGGAATQGPREYFGLLYELLDEVLHLQRSDSMSGQPHLKTLSQMLLLGRPGPIRSLQSAGLLALLILFADFGTPETVSRLRELGRLSLQGVTDVLESRLLPHAIRFIAQVARGAEPTKRSPTRAAFLTFAEAKRFFCGDGLKRRQDLARQLVEYTDTTKAIPSNAIEDLLSKLAGAKQDDSKDNANPDNGEDPGKAERDMVLSMLAITMLRRRLLVTDDRAEIIGAIKLMFDTAMNEVPAYAFAPGKEYLGQISGRTFPGPFSLTVASRALFVEGFTCKEAAAAYEELVGEYLKKFHGIWVGSVYSRRFTYLAQLNWAEACVRRPDEFFPADGSALQLADLPLGPQASGLLKSIIDDEDYVWLVDLITYDLLTQAVQCGHLVFAFDVLKQLVGSIKTTEAVRASASQNPKFQEFRYAVVGALAKIRVYYPDRVDDFLCRHDMDDEFCDGVYRYVAVEQIRDFLNYRSLAFWDRNLACADAEVWRDMQEALELIPLCESLDKAMMVGLGFVIHAIAGDPTVFKKVGNKLKKPAAAIGPATEGGTGNAP